MDRRRVLFGPKAERDLLKLPERHAGQILEDIPLLESPPWPQGKVKKLRETECWELKTGDYRTIFWPHGRDVIVVRLVNRRDLDRVVGRISFLELRRWAAGHSS